MPAWLCVMVRRRPPEFGVGQQLAGEVVCEIMIFDRVPLTQAEVGGREVRIAASGWWVLRNCCRAEGWPGDGEV